MEMILKLPVSITSKPTDREAGKGLQAGRGAF